MNVKEAVNIAKHWVNDILSDEGVSNVGLEEVQYDDLHRIWNITVGFSRPWNSNFNALSGLARPLGLNRAYRVIAVEDTTGKVISMKKREDDAA